MFESQTNKEQLKEIMDAKLPLLYAEGNPITEEQESKIP